MTRARSILFSVVAAMLWAGCEASVDDGGGLDRARLDEDDEGGLVDVQGSGNWTVFANPYGNGTANPADGVSGNVIEKIYTNWELTVVKVETFGMAPDRVFGAHVHKLSCANTQGGGHYQNSATGGANPENEIWLDFTTDNEGQGDAVAWNAFFIRRGEALSVVVHDHATDGDGKAGPKLACIDVNF